MLGARKPEHLSSYKKANVFPCNVNFRIRRTVNMSIELLWLIPIIAVALIVPVIIYSTKNRPNQSQAGRHAQDLAREVEMYNENGLPKESGRAEKRLGEIEKTISRVSDVLSSQQKIIRDVVGKDASRETGLMELKQKLRELQNEYDIVISENYSLRSRVKKLIEDRKSSGSSSGSAVSPGDEICGPGDTDKEDRPVNMQLYDDTRTFKQSELDGEPDPENSES
jgi:hypothetical protein